MGPFGVRHTVDPFAYLSARAPLTHGFSAGRGALTVMLFLVLRLPHGIVGKEGKGKKLCIGVRLAGLEMNSAIKRRQEPASPGGRDSILAAG